MREFLTKNGWRIRCAVFALCVLAAVGIPVLHARKYMAVRDQGMELKFRCGGYDPYTPFLGRYLTVRLKPNQFAMQKQFPAEQQRGGRTVYVKFRAGKDGFAEIVSCDLQEPADMTGVWKISPVYVDRTSEKKTVFRWWKYPVDRYYLNEDLAKTADRRLRLAQSDMTAFVLLKDGCGIIRRLTIKGEKAEDHLRKLLAEDQRKKKATASPSK